jgi:hypothetical protein
VGLAQKYRNRLIFIRQEAKARSLLLVKNKELLSDASCLGQSFTPKFIYNVNGLKQ